MKNTESYYKRVAYFCSLLLIVGLFIELGDETQKSIFDFVYDLIAITAFTFAYLWLKRRVLLIGLAFYVVSWNVDILLNPLTQIQNQYILEYNLMTISKIFNVIGFSCLLVGFIEKFEHKYLTKRIEFSLKFTAVLLLGVTGLIQLLIRMI